MAYQALINKSLKLAFKMMKDLVVEVTLTKSETSDFDFSGEASPVVPSIVVSEGIVLETKKVSKQSNTIKSQLLLKTKDIGDLSLFDVVTINGLNWKMGNPLTTDGFATIIEIYREV